MKSNMSLLLKNQLLSTSSWNILKYSDDRKKKNQIIAGYFGMGFLYLLLLGYCIVMSIGYGNLGLTNAIPQMCATVVILLEFIFTVIKTNGYLFAFKEYDMVMSLPFRAYEIAGTRFIYMYIKNFLWVASISIAMMVGYAIYAPVTVLTIVIWIVLTLFLPLVPMVIAAAIGSLITAIGSGFRHKQLIQTVLTFIFMIICFSLRFIIDAIVKEDKLNDVINGTSNLTGALAKYFLPISWFEKAVFNDSILYAFLFIAVSLAVFAIFCLIIGKFYMGINSRLQSSAARKKYKMQRQKKRNVINAVVFKEFKRMVGSTIYITNACIGQVMCFAITVAAIFVNVKGLLSNLPFAGNFIGAIPILFYFMLGMLATTACSLSLEGKNYWIVQSLPIDMKTLFQGKMLFNIYITVPFMIFGCVVLGIKMSSGFFSTLVATVFGISLCLFSTAWGMRCGAKHARFDWENEVEVINQGTAVAVYLFPNMFGVMILGSALVYLSVITNVYVTLLPASAVVLLLAWLSYRSAMKCAK